MGKPEFSVVRNKYLFTEGIQKKFLQTEQLFEIYGWKHQLFPLVMNISLSVDHVPNISQSLCDFSEKGIICFNSPLALQTTHGALQQLDAWLGTGWIGHSILILQDTVELCFTNGIRKSILMRFGRNADDLACTRTVIHASMFTVGC